MALVKIKRRNDLVRISNERAQKLKVILHGDPAAAILPSPRTDRVDLGEWAGEISEISSIELDRHEGFTTTEIPLWDLDKTEKEIKAFKDKKFPKAPESIGARLVTAEEQYMAARGVIRLSPYGDITVTDPVGYNAIDIRIELIGKRKAKKEFGIKKGLSDLAAGMKV